ncbi:MAG: ABC transporter permease [Bryobacteraceae bacterium]|nr:ABC transporter permease [Bryobacteraceae bacterium]
MLTWLTVLASRLQAMFGRERDGELAEELETHLALLTEENLRRGLSPEAARRAAHLKLGGAAQIHESYRDQLRLPQLDTLLQDLRFGCRTLVKSPGFTAVAALTLALGIGANTVIFSVAQLLFLAPLPYPEPQRLVNIWTSYIAQPGSKNIISAPNFLDWQAQSTVFQSMAFFDSAGKGYSLAGAKDPERVQGLRVSASLFPTLGVRPLLGRTFTLEEETLGKHRVVVLSHGLWQRRYGGDRQLVGRSIRVDGESFAVIGVMPSGFNFAGFSSQSELWVPVGLDVGDRQRSSNSFGSCARLKPGVTLAQANQEMGLIARRLAQQYPKDVQGAGQTATVTPLSDLGVKNLESTFVALFAVVGFVLLIACVNVANLMLARGAARQKELGIRRALGAGRWRIVRQLLTESLILAFLGGILGLALAAVGIGILEQTLPTYVGALPLRSFDNIRLDANVFVFNFLICGLTGALFGLVAGFSALRLDVNVHLKEGQGRGATGQGGRLRYALVAAEVALALGVLTGAGVMLESMTRVLRVEPGFNPRNVLTLRVSLPQKVIYYGPPVRGTFCRDLSERAGAIPGVLSVSAISHLPVSGASAGRSFNVEGRADPGPDERPQGGYAVACPDYFRAMGIPLLAGREFDHRDTAGSLPVALINQAMAQRIWPGRSPIGQRIRLEGVSDAEPWITIVGTVGAVHHHGLDEAPPAELYRPYTQAAWPGMTVVVRTASTPETFTPLVKAALLATDPDQAASGVATMADVIQRSMGPRRVPTFLIAAFGLLALLLAGVGISGVVSYSVAQRAHEIGIRIAMGARPVDVLKLLVGHSMSWTLAGVACGIGAAFGITRLLAGMLYGVAPMDPRVLFTATLLLAAVALLACYLPARRATKLDPVIALRGE